MADTFDEDGEVVDEAKERDHGPRFLESQMSEVDAGTKVDVPILFLFNQLNAKLVDQDRVNDQRLTTQDALLRRIDKRLDNAATKADVQRIEGVLDKHEKDITILREQVHEDRVERGFRQRIVKNLGWFIAAVMVPIGAAIILVVATHTHG